MDDPFNEKLAYFKQNEKPETVLLVSGDLDRIRIIVAWTNMQIRRVEKLTELKSESENDVWEWLWENVDYSKEMLVAKVGTTLSVSALEIRLKPLIGNRILYPDGTVNSFVQRYLREQVVKLFETKPKRPTKKA